MKYQTLHSILVISILIIACAKEPSYVRDAGDIEAYKLEDSMIGKIYVFTKAVDDRGRDLLKGKYRCMADDTFYMRYTPHYPWYDVLIKQGAINCAPISGDQTAKWGTASNYMDDLEISLDFPFAYTTVNVDTSGNIVSYNYYSPIPFFKLADNRNKFTYDSSFNLDLMILTDTTKEYFHLAVLNGK